jgi:hypothetical protein
MTPVITAIANLFGIALALVAAVLGYFHGIGTVAVIFRSVAIGFGAALFVRMIGVLVVKMLVAQVEKAEKAERAARMSPEPSSDPAGSAGKKAA